MLRSTMITVAALFVAIVASFAVVRLVSAAGSLPSVQSVAETQSAGLNWWRVSFSNGVSCDVERPLSETLTGSRPAIGAVRSYKDGRMFIGETRLWGALQFTDAAGAAHACY